MKQDLLLFFIFFMSCTPQKNLEKPPSAGLGAFDKEGHRGCRGLMPENTIPAMIKALDLGVTTLEMDIAMTKDKQPVLSHEPWFAQDITTKPDGTYMKDLEERQFVIYWMTYEQVKTFDVGMKPHLVFRVNKK
jgi:glycerophosphoryl diester phosphodiesterase